MRSKSADRLTPAVVVANADKKTEKEKAKSRAPALDAYLKIVNPKDADNEAQLKLLTSAVLELVKGAT